MGRSTLLAFLVICFLAVLSAQLLGGPEDINDLSDPGVVAAATAAVEYLNAQRPPNAKELILVRIINGTEQVEKVIICKHIYSRTCPTLKSVSLSILVCVVKPYSIP